MFTGLIEKAGRVKAIRNIGHSFQIEIMTDWSDLVLGESIAVNGACLTTSKIFPGGFSADLSQETIERTSFSDIKIGAIVNLERAIKAGERFGGHFVSGHVDCTAKIAKIVRKQGGTEIKIALARNNSKYIVEKGSVAVDGISLTIFCKEYDGFWISIIPHTMKNTNLNDRKTGDKVNLEFDMMVKYTESLLNKDRQ